MDRGFNNPFLRRAYLGAACCRWAAGCARSGGNRWVTLYYHAVGEDEREAFARQMASVAQRAVAASQVGVAGLERGGPRVAVTFDDAFACLLDNAVPTLVEQHVPATVFVPTGSLGRSPAWRIDDAREARQRVMSARELRELPEEIISIGSHCETHLPLDIMAAKDAARELTRSRATLEDMLGKPVGMLAFPHGAYNARVVEMAYEAGYTRLFTIEACVHPGPLPMGLIGRFAAEPGESLWQFRLKAAGAYDWLHAVRHAKRSAAAVAGRVLCRGRRVAEVAGEIQSNR